MSQPSLAQKIVGKFVAFRHWIKTVRKAVVPVVAGVIALLSLPQLGVDPEWVVVVTTVASALGVYSAKNVATEPKQHG